MKRNYNNLVNNNNNNKKKIKLDYKNNKRNYNFVDNDDNNNNNKKSKLNDKSCYEYDIDYDNNKYENIICDKFISYIS